PGGGHLGALGEGEAGAGGDVVAARGGGDLAAPVAAAVDGAVHGDGERLVEPEGEAVLDPDGALLAEGRRLVEGVAGCSVALPGEDQKQGGDEQGGEFEPVLEGLDEGDAAHAAGGDDGGDDDGDAHPAEPVGRAGQHGEGESGALEPGQQVEPADADDERPRQPAHRLGGQPGLGEVGEGVGAGAAQRGGDE